MRRQKEEEAIIDVSSPLLFCVGPKYIYRKTNKENNLMKDVMVCPIDISHCWKTKCRVHFWNV
jgi:hypothetical protein